VQQGVKQVGYVLALLAMEKGAELEREKGTDLADAGVNVLIGAHEIATGHGHAPGGLQRAHHAGHDAGGHIVDEARAARVIAVLHEKIDIHGEAVDLALKAAGVDRTGAKTLRAKIGGEGAILAGTGAK
jgi:hypothetical protein